jgi:hypothetical protein
VNGTQLGPLLLFPVPLQSPSAGAIGRSASAPSSGPGCTSVTTAAGHPHFSHCTTCPVFLSTLLRPQEGSLPSLKRFWTGRRSSVGYRVGAVATRTPTSPTLDCRSPCPTRDDSPPPLLDDDPRHASSRYCKHLRIRINFLVAVCLSTAPSPSPVLPPPSRNDRTLVPCSNASSNNHPRPHRPPSWRCPRR